MITKRICLKARGQLFVLRVCLFAFALLERAEPAVAMDPTWRPFEIQVLDAATGEGIPLVTLKTVHAVEFVTDNAGRIAYDEPQHDGATLFFQILAPGYRVPRDGFGIAGKSIAIESGGRIEIELEREQAAVRLFRITGADRYRDSRILGYDVPPDDGLGIGLVAGQDSVQAVVYQDSVRWFWGDTQRLSYPLGLFRTAGARTSLTDLSQHDLKAAFPLEYFCGPDGFARAMIELPESEGVVWIDGLGVVSDAQQQTRMVGHYTRRESLQKEYEHGLLVYDDDHQRFVRFKALPLDERWRHPRGRGVLRDEPEGQQWWFGDVFPTTRVPATLDAMGTPELYESWSCLDPNQQDSTAAPLRDPDGSLAWQWRATRPVTPDDERRWLEAGRIQAQECRFLPEDARVPGKRILLHSGSVRWNPYRGRWIMIAVELAHENSPSLLGEVWYSESDSPLGPFQKAWKVLTHDRQSFYNPCHHDFLDRDGGRQIHFEGTYSSSFTSSVPTPRYEYNQILYRLDLDSADLVEIFGPARPVAAEPDRQRP